MIDFNDNPEMDVRELQGELKRIVQQFNDGAAMISVIGIVVADTNEFAVAHGLNTIPRAATLVPYSGFGWRKVRPPDAKCVYFAVSNPMTVDCLIFP